MKNGFDTAEKESSTICYEDPNHYNYHAWISLLQSSTIIESLRECYYRWSSGFQRLDFVSMTLLSHVAHAYDSCCKAYLEKEQNLGLRDRDYEGRFRPDVGTTW